MWSVGPALRAHNESLVIGMCHVSPDARRPTVTFHVLSPARHYEPTPTN